MFYTLLTFVGLFIVTTTLAVIFYVKAEDYRTKTESLQNQIDELATGAERQKIGAIVGAKQGRRSRLGTMVDYLDQMVSLIIGGVVEDTSAEVKVGKVNAEVKDKLGLLAREYGIETTDPNTTGLVRMTEKLEAKLNETQNMAAAFKEQLETLRGRFDDAMAAGLEKEQMLIAEKEKYQQQVNKVTQDYNELKALMEKTAEQQVQTLYAQLDEEKANNKQLNQNLLKTQAELKMAEDRVKYIQKELSNLVPPPDSEAPAFKPDGKIMLLDEQNKIVHLNIGGEDHVYQGLTFSVYDKSMPIPKDGKGKAEVEVFNVGKNISAARILRSELNRPVIVDDIVANLIWDGDKVNIFVVAGDFDLNGDGQIDYNAVDKIKALIEKWGGRVADKVSIDTNFVVLGSAPRILQKPTREEMDVDPMAMDKYDKSLQRFAHYEEVQNQTQVFSIPIFNYDRFLYFIGYKSQSARPGAF